MGEEDARTGAVVEEVEEGAEPNLWKRRSLLRKVTTSTDTKKVT